MADATEEPKDRVDELLAKAAVLIEEAAEVAGNFYSAAIVVGIEHADGEVTGRSLIIGPDDVSEEECNQRGLDCLMNGIRICGDLVGTPIRFVAAGNIGQG